MKELHVRSTRRRRGVGARLMDELRALAAARPGCSRPSEGRTTTTRTHVPSTSRWDSRSAVGRSSTGWTPIRTEGWCDCEGRAMRPV
ncbi:hypothetical protein [Streptomyces niveus]|uniref:hypothetical protein n=1 Tax=Streptomyces niveus TaxID=193462 RepID=UPI0035DC5A6D